MLVYRHIDLNMIHDANDEKCRIHIFFSFTKLPTINSSFIHFSINLKIQFCYLCEFIKCACIWLTFISNLLFQNLPLRSLNVDMYVHGIINMSLFLISTNIKLHKFLFSLTSKKNMFQQQQNNRVSGNFIRIFRNNEKCTYQTTGEMYIVVNIKKQISFRRDVLFIIFFELTQLKMF